MSRAAFARAIGIADSHLSGLLSGRETISIALARRISAAIGGPVEFWLARDGQYRDDLQLVEADHWAESLPITQMVQFGWMDKPSNWHDRVSACLRFFDVSDVPEWQRTYGTLLADARFRASDKVELDPIAVAAWLRKAELDVAELDCSDWNPTAFKTALEELRPLTRLSNPRTFLPPLIGTCAGAGVALTVLRAPAHCPVSGAARFLEGGRPNIVLSARYLSDDHLWFSFFHEAAHILLHQSSAVYLDELERRAVRPANKDEREADDFASNVLVPPAFRDELLNGRPTPARLHHLANVTGVSSGILVGQLQHAGVLGYGSVLNRLKRRYKWVGSSLEKA
jgi:HTH-type transcriptional regulator/antitoxin HigA